MIIFWFFGVQAFHLLGDFYLLLLSIFVWCYYKWDFFLHFIFRLIVYRNVTGFCMSICSVQGYWICLFHQDFFDGVFRVFYIYCQAVYAQGKLYFFLANLDFISFSYLIALARTSSIVLWSIEMVKVGILVLFMILQKIFSFSPLRIMLTVGFTYVLR